MSRRIWDDQAARNRAKQRAFQARKKAERLRQLESSGTPCDAPSADMNTPPAIPNEEDELTALVRKLVFSDSETADLIKEAGRRGILKRVLQLGIAADDRKHVLSGVAGASAGGSCAVRASCGSPWTRSRPPQPSSRARRSSKSCRFRCPKPRRRSGHEAHRAFDSEEKLAGVAPSAL